jgi:hypothetical protein
MGHPRNFGLDPLCTGPWRCRRHRLAWMASWPASSSRDRDLTRLAGDPETAGRAGRLLPGHRGACHSAALRFSSVAVGSAARRPVASPVESQAVRRIGDIADVVDSLDVPVATYPDGELGRACLAGGQAGDGVDGEGQPFLLAGQGPDPRVTRRAWAAWGKGSPAATVCRLKGAVFFAVVPAVALPVAGGDGLQITASRASARQRHRRPDGARYQVRPARGSCARGLAGCLRSTVRVRYGSAIRADHSANAGPSA